MAVFDIDGTLVAGPGTEKRLFLELLRNGWLSPGRLLAFLWFALRWSPAFGRHVFRKDKAYLAGLTTADLESFSADWVRRGLDGRWFEPCVARLREHKAAGDRVVLLSGTPDFLASAIAEALGVGESIGTRCATRAGRFLARPPERHPFAEAKAAIVRELCTRHGVLPRDVVAYADSSHDLPLLRSVGRAVAVRPDVALAAVAATAGWEIIGDRRQSRAIGPVPAPADDSLPKR